jgi:type IV conjugative transfer system protein TraL
MSLESISVAHGLDDPARFLVFDFNLVLIACTVTFIGALLKHPLIGAVMGVAAAVAWHRVLMVHGRGIALALAYWHLDLVQLRSVPPSHKRFLLG